MDFIQQEQINNPLVWYYNPLAINFTRRLEASAIVYDCMDELSAFRGAREGLRTAEAELFSRADLVFTGGRTLYEAKKKQHHSVHCFPSSIDREFFGKAREAVADPADQAGIPHPRVGFAGVIDERMDMELLEGASAARRDWHFVMIGPTAKIAESELPRSSNLHWMGAKPYSQLPQYMAGWDVGLMPFARNEATRFISPTKTPEYLAAGLPVVSTSIADVVRPYGELRLVHIADDARSFVGAVQLALAERNCKQRLTATDKFLKSMSWDLTWVNMNRLVNGVAGQEGMQSRTTVTAPLKSAMAAD